MALTILYFARLREEVALAREQLAFEPRLTSVAALLEQLRQRGGKWTAALALDRPFRVAVNQTLADESSALNDGDEVALFPPVTGG